MAAYRMVLLNWKILRPECFSIETWVLEFSNLLGMEQIADMIRAITF